MSLRYRHKRGGLYTLIYRRVLPLAAPKGERLPVTVDGFLGFATATDDLMADQEAVFYLGEDGRAWVRPAALFDDPERFTPLEDPS